METLLSPPDVAALLRSRRTIHAFDPNRPVSGEAVLEALEAAIYAPNHKVTEPWRFYILGDETRAQLCVLNSEVVRERQGDEAAANKLRRWREIPGFLVVTCQRSDDPLHEREDYAACACAVQNLMLYLWSAGIGTKWTTGAVTRESAFYELIGANPARESVVALVHYGYPAVTPEARRQPVETKTQFLP